MGIRVVVNGATLKCTEGTKDSNLVATHEPFVALNGETVASVLDHEPGTNILPFGNCKAKEEKEGKPCKCKADTPSPWQPGARAVLLPTLSDAAVEVSLLECTEGGIIRITDPGQSVMEIAGVAEAELRKDLINVLDDLPNKLLEGLAKGLGFGSASELNKFAKSLADDPWAKRMLGGKAKAIFVLAALLDGKDVVDELGKGNTNAAIAKALGIGVDIGVSGACVSALGSAEVAGVATAVLIPITAAGCGVAGSFAGHLTTKVAKPIIDTVEGIVKDII